MKLHLPRKLFAAVLALFCLSAAITCAAEDSSAVSSTISVNFSKDGSHDVSGEGELNGVSADGWTNISSIPVTDTAIYVTPGDSSSELLGTMTISGGYGLWAPENNLSTLVGTMRESYIDLANSDGKRNWNVVVDTSVQDAMLHDVYLYLAGDGGNFSAVTVNNTMYVGGTDVSTTSSTATWGTRENSDSVSDANTIVVTRVGDSRIEMENVWNGQSHRSTLAGFQVVDSTAKYLWVSPSGDLTVGNDTTFTKADGSSSSYADITSDNRYFGFSNQAVTFSGATVLNGIQATEGNVTVSVAEGGSLSVPLLFAKNGASLTVTSNLSEAALITGGYGTVKLTGSLTNTGTLIVGADTEVTTYSTSSTGAIKVEAGKTLTIQNGADYNHDGNAGDLNFAMLGLLAAADASDGYTGTVAIEGKILCGGERAASDIEVRGNYLLKGGMSVNSYNSWGETTQHVQVLAGGSLTAQNDEGVRQDIEILSNQKLTIDGGSVTAGALKVGHSSSGNYSGTLLLKSGSLSVDYISLQNDNTGTNSDGTGKGSLFRMEGGTLSILSNTWNNGGAIRIADDDTEIQLLGGTIKSEISGGWPANFRENTKVTLGDIHFEGAYDIAINYGVAYFVDTVTNRVSGNQDGLRFGFNTYVVEDEWLLDNEAIQLDSSENGFGTRKFWMVKKGEGSNAKLTCDGTTVWLGGTEANGGQSTAMTVADGGAYFTISDTIYYVNAGSVTHGSSEAAGATGYVLNSSNSPTLSFTSTPDSSFTNGITVKQNAFLELDGEEVKINASQVTHDGGTLTLTGTGTFMLDQAHANLTNNAPTGYDFTNAAWQGTLHLSGNGSEAFNGLDWAKCGTENSTIKLQGIKCWTQRNEAVSHVIFENTADGSKCAWEITNGSSGAELVFSGKVSGGGNVVRAWNHGTAGNGNLTYTFTNDVSGWSGNFRVTDAVQNGNTSLVFKEGATDIRVGLQTDDQDGASLNATVDNSADVTMASAMTGLVNVTYKGTGTKTVTNTGSDYSGTTTVESGAVVVNSGVKLGTGAVTVKGGSLQLADGASLRSTVNVQDGSTAVATIAGKEGSNHATFSGAVTLTSDKLSGGSLSAASVTVSKDFALEGVTAQDCEFSINAALQLDAASSLANGTTVNIGAAGALVAESGSLALGEGNSLTLDVFEGSNVSFNGATLTSVQLQGVTSGSFVLEAGQGLLAQLADIKTDITLVFSTTLPTVQTAQLLADTGSAYTTSAPANEGIALAVETPVAASTTSSGLSFTLGSSFEGTDFKLVQNEDGSYTLKNTETIPEPATATLSLLALAALAARRRRK